MIVLSDEKVLIAGRGGWFFEDAPLHSVWLTPLDALVIDLRLRNTHVRIKFVHQPTPRLR